MTDSSMTSRRHIGHEHLVALGFPLELIAQWLRDGLLNRGTWAGFYEYASTLDLRALSARRVVGRGHLLDLGVDASELRRWRRSGALLPARDRGFYLISAGLFCWVVGRPTDAAVPSHPASPEAVTPAATEPVESSSKPTVSVKSSEPARLRVVACTITQARAFVAEHHRHLGPPVSGLFAVGLARGPELIGVAIVGRPVARGLQDGTTAEVTRVCTLGDRNACSMLLSACRRGSVALGYRRLVTYTLSSEPGTSLRAAGWRQVAAVRGRSWNCPTRPRGETAVIVDKRRWEAPLPSPAALRPAA